MLSFIKENLFLFIFVFLLICAPWFVVSVAEIFIYLILALFVIIIIGTLVLRWKIRKMAKEGRFTGFGGGAPFNNGDSTQEDGTDPRVRVFRTSQSGGTGDKKVSPKVGDYVDFEEVKEEK